MTASIIAIVTNFVLNYILIFGSFGAPRLGVVGAAIATVIARYIEAIYLIIHTHRREKNIYFLHRAYIKPVFARCRREKDPPHRHAAHA